MAEHLYPIHEDIDLANFERRIHNHSLSPVLGKQFPHQQFLPVNSESMYQYFFSVQTQQSLSWGWRLDCESSSRALSS